MIYALVYKVKYDICHGVLQGDIGYMPWCITMWNMIYAVVNYKVKYDGICCWGVKYYKIKYGIFRGVLQGNIWYIYIRGVQKSKIPDFNLLYF